MLRLNFICILLLAVGFCNQVEAQLNIIPKEVRDSILSPELTGDSAYLVFDRMYISADLMNENDPPVTYRYNVTNTGNEPLRILRMSTTCSCVSAICGSQVIRPGESSFISVRYDPKGHPGRFERRIFVYTREGDRPSAILTLSVSVSAGSELLESYPVQMGVLRLRRTEVCFDADRGKSVEKIRFINLSGRPMKLQCENLFLPECIGFSTRPETVEDGEEGEILITYDPSKGGSRDRVPVIVKGLDVPPSQSTILVRISGLYH